MSRLYPGQGKPKRRRTAHEEARPSCARWQVTRPRCPAWSVGSATWTGLRRRVIGIGGRGVAARFTRHVAAMRRLQDGPPAALQHEAAAGLELVDALEREFRRG